VSVPLALRVDTLGACVVFCEAQYDAANQATGISLSFIEPVQIGSFTVADVVLVGPGGTIANEDIAVAPVGVGGGATVASAFALTFPPQGTEGAYTLTVGPEVLDVAGNTMRQSQTATQVEDAFADPALPGWTRLGSAAWVSAGTVRLTNASGQTGGIYRTTGFAAAPFTAEFTLEYAAGSVADGMAFVVASQPTSLGGSGGGLGYLGLANASFAVEFDIWNNGSGNGDADSNHVALDWNGAFRSGAVNVPQSFIGTGVFQAVVTFDGSGAVALVLRQPNGNQVVLAGTVPANAIPGTMHIGFTGGTGGGAATILIHGVDVAGVVQGSPGPFEHAFAVDRTGPRVVGTAPGGEIHQLLGSFIEVEFDEPIEASSFTPSDVVLLDPAGQAVAATGVTPQSDTVLRVAFANQTALGTYTLRVGPAVTDRFGNAMDQDGDGTNGEAVEDRYETSITVRIDGPMVTGMTPTGATNDPALTTLTVALSKTVLGLSARAVSSYGLLHLGVDRAPGGGDDTAIALTPAYTDGTTAVTLTTAAPLVEGAYQLTVLGGTETGIRDELDLPLDQNRDGLADNYTGTFDVDFTAPTVTSLLAAGALEFDGTNDVVFLPYGTINGQTDVTIEVWFRTTLDDTRYLLSGARSGNDNAFLIGIGESYLSLYTDGSPSPVSWDERDTPPVPALNDGRWRHLAIVRDATADQVTAYLDGVSYGTRAATMGAISVAAGGFVMGQDQDSIGGGFQVSQAFLGQVTELRLWQGLRTATEIQEGMFSRAAGTEVNLLACWPLTEGVGTTALNVVGTGDGTFGSGTAATHPAWTGSTAPVDTLALWLDFADLVGLDPATVEDLAAYRLVASGGDLTFGDGNESDASDLLAAVVYDGGSGRANVLLTGPLPTDAYRLEVPTEHMIRDLAGNPLADGFDYLTPAVTVTTGLPAVSVRLAADDDTGTSNSDAITTVLQPTIEVAVDRAGTISLDLDRDGTSEQTRNVATGGTFAFEPAAPFAADAARTLAVTFVPVLGMSVTRELTVVVDTLGPAVLPAPNRALLFDGSDDLVLIGDQALFVMTDTLTIEVWVFPTSGSSSRIIINKEGEYELDLSGGVLRWAFANTDPGWHWVSTGYEPPLNQWTHLAVVYDHATVASYANGVQVHRYVGSGSIGDQDPTRNQLRLGDRQAGGSARFSGGMAGVALWNTARTAAQVRADLVAGVVAPQAGLVGFWPLDDGHGETAADRSGNGNAGALGGGTASALPAWAVLPAGVTNPAVGTSLRFDGSNDFVSLGDVLDAGTGSLTVEAWFMKTSTTTANAKIVNKGLTSNGTPPDAGYALRITGGLLEFMVSSGAGNLTAVSVEPSINAWHHAAGVLDRAAGEIRLYVDGVLRATRATGALGSLDTNIPLAFGALHRGSFGNTTEYFPGCLDEVRIWTTARSGAEIAAAMRQSLAGNEAGLAGYWRLDDGMGLTAADAATPAHPAQLGGGAVGNAPAWTGLAPAARQRVLRVGFLDLGGVAPGSVATPAFWQLTAAGPDGLFGTADDVEITPSLGAIAWDAATQTAILGFAESLPDDPIRVLIDGTAGIVDLAGNALGGGTDLALSGLWSETSPATVAVDLPAADDSGVSDSDNVTSQTSPTVTVSVNRAGRIDLDLDGDGITDGTSNTLAAGTVSFPAPAPLADDTYRVQATFVPAFGDVATAALLLTIDTTGPTAAADPSLLSPIYRQRVVFSEPVALASLTVADVTLHAADGSLLGTATGVAPDAAETAFNAATGHWYRAVAVPGGITWAQAEHAALAMGGTLVCIGDAAENTFVRGLVSSLDYWVLYSGSYHGPFIGLRQAHKTLEPSGGWEWVNGDPLTYAAWNSGQPSDSGGNEDWGHYHLFDAGATWNDLPPDWAGPGFIVEFTAAPTVAAAVEVTFAPLWEAGQYSLRLGPDVTDLAGNPMNQDGDGTNGEPADDRLTCSPGIPAPVAGLRVERLEVRGPDEVPLRSIEVVFDRPIDPGSVASQDITLVNAAGTVFHPVPALLNECVLSLDLTGLALTSPCTLLVGPEIAAAAGPAMDQDGDGTPGEAGDVFRALLLTDDHQIAAANLTQEGWALVAVGATLTADGPHQFASVDLLRGALLTHPPATASQEFRLELTLAGHLRVDEVSAVDASGRGYLAGRTLGNTTEGAASGKSAGSYGGYGAGDSGTTNDVYGDYRDPDEPGSGGTGNITVANAGGGRVRLAAAVLHLEGVIRANGGNGQDNGWGWYAGAGAGGGIRLEVGRLGGSGRVQADGGSYGPRGGGGRVAVYYHDATAFDLNRVQALPGELGWGPASCGTVYLRNTAARAPGELRIDSRDRALEAGNYTALGIGTDPRVEAEDLVVRGPNVVVAPHHQMPVLIANLDLLEGAVLTHRATDSANEFGLLLDVSATLTIDATSAIDVSSRGYLPNRTIGNTATGGASGQSAASYGGYGASNSGGTNDVYGDYRNPNELGSGGSGNIAIANAGGGLVRVRAAVVQIEGTIRANGGNGQDNGWGWYAGGGSGGGVHLDVGLLAGAGLIQADGGSNGPRAGGGRVAVYYDDASGFDLDRVQALPGSGGWGPASCGTVYLKDLGGEGVLRVDGKGRTLEAGAWTPLGLAVDDAFTADRLVLAGAGVVAAPHHQMPLQVVSLDVLAGAALTHLPCTASLTYGLEVVVTGTVTVDDGGRIDVSGRGYLAGRTTGNSTSGGTTGQSGASYGGLGVAVGGASNALYGSATRPDEPGSGGSGNIAIANAGGGLLHLAGGSLVLNGSLRANGANGQDNGWGWASGAGSGGGVLLDLGTLTGTGFISANGGNGAGPAGAGGGGRIAIHCTGANTLVPGHVTASGGTGGPGPGGDGTINLEPAGNESTPPFLLSVSPSGVVEEPLSQISILFSEALNAATFTVADVVLLRPDGTPVPGTGMSLAPAGVGRFNLNLNPALTQDGFYFLTIGPEVADTAGNTMLVAGEAFLTVDRLGPRIEAIVPAGQVFRAFDRLDITFDQPVTAGSFTLADILLTTPSGAAASLTSLTATGERSYQLLLASQETPGTYELRIGPAINDQLGRLMDQDGNGVGGDPFVARLDVFLPNLAFVATTPPAFAIPGQPVSLSWTARNNGDADTTQTWTDAVYLSSDDVLDPGDQLLGTLAAGTPALAIGAAYARTASVGVPITVQPGNWYLLVVLDQTDAQPEKNESAADNLRAHLVPVKRIAPDLAVACAQEGEPGYTGYAVFSATGEAQTRGQAALVGETVAYLVKVINLNTSAEAFRVTSSIAGYGWEMAGYDDITAGNDITASLTGSGWTTPVLAAGGDCVIRLEVTPGIGVSVGAYDTLLVRATATDSSRTDVARLETAVALEHLPVAADDFQAGVSPGWSHTTVATTPAGGRSFLGTFSAGTVTLTVAGLPDHSHLTLDVDLVTLLSWDGSGGGPDLIEIACDGQAVLYSSFALYGSTTQSFPRRYPEALFPLATGAAEHNTFGGQPMDAVYPLTFVIAHSADTAVFTFRGLNLQGAGDEAWGLDNAVVTASTQEEPPDLVPSGLVFTGDPAWGHSIQFSWLVSNLGPNPARGDWTDRIWLSADTAVDGADTLLASYEAAAQSPLAPGDSYPAESFAQLPVGLAGSLYLLAETDATNRQVETDDGNNTTAVPIYVNAPDLIVAAVQAPGTARTGDTITVTWRVENAGAAPTAVNAWSDRVLLSRDAALGEDLTLATFARSGSLAPAATYTRSETVRLPEDLAGGDWYVLAVVDILAQSPELDEANNATAGAAPVNVSLAPVPDLVVTDVSFSGTPAPGAPISVRWTTRNQGAALVSSAWQERVYIAPQGTTGLTRLAEFSITTPLAPGAALPQQRSVTLPVLDDGLYDLVVETDAAASVFERDGEGNNRTTGTTPLDLRHPDLTCAITTAPTAAQSGDTVSLTWRVSNGGTGPTAQSWLDRVWLRLAAGGSETLLASVEHAGGLVATGTYSATAEVVLPDGIAGAYTFIVRTDATSLVNERTGEGNNTATANLAVTRAQYPDLELVRVLAPELLIGDPVDLSVTWQVRNAGTAEGRTATWTDRVWLSADANLGGDQLLGEVPHTGLVPPGFTYDGGLIVTLPAGFVERRYVIVEVNAGRSAFEYPDTAPNVGTPGHPTDAMVIPYADLIVGTVNASPAGQNGQPITVAWSVANQGIGPTDTSSWHDRVYLLGPGKPSRVHLGSFSHVGALGAGASYERSAQVALPANTASGTYTLQVETGGPFEFIFTGNNSAQSGPVQVTYVPPPQFDLEVTAASGPAAGDTVLDGDWVDISWTVTNHGPDTVPAAWYDSVYVALNGDVGRLVELGRFSRGAPLDSGRTYSRTELVRLPTQTQGLYRVFVTTDSLTEQGETDEGNNRRGAANTFLIGLRPRPDLQVTQLTAPDQVPAGSVIDVEWVVTNLGSADTPTGGSRWLDGVYLSFDHRLDSGDWLLERKANGSALAAAHAPEPAQSYRSVGVYQLPSQAGGNMFVLVKADVNNAVDEYPADDNNTAAYPIAIDVQPVPPPDLVVSDVAGPSDVFEGGTFSVRYRVTNNGAGITYPASWTDAVWLTLGRDRPSSARGDVRLGSFGHGGALEVGQYYERTVQVSVPEGRHLRGQYYITVWTDSGDAVYEASFDINLNPDAPNDIHGSNFKAGNLINVLYRPAPDLRVIALDAPAQARAGERVTISWTVANRGPVVTDVPTWGDGIWLSTDDDLEDGGGEAFMVFGLPHNGALGPDETYTQTATFTLPPAARGSYLIVRTNQTVASCTATDPDDADSEMEQLTQQIEGITSRAQEVLGKPLTEASAADLRQLTREQILYILVDNPAPVPNVWEGPNTDNNTRTAPCEVTGEAPDLAILDIRIDTPPPYYSGGCSIRRMTECS
jgi:subtilase family serine protease